MSADRSNNSYTTTFRDAVDKHHGGKRLGENLCPEYTDQGIRSTILTLSQLVRGGDPKNLVHDVLTTGTTNDVADLFVLLFATRNTRGGKGEKKLAYDMFLEIYMKYPETGNELIRLFPHYGYWKDMLLILKQSKTYKSFSQTSHYEMLYKTILDVMQAQFREDIAIMEIYKAKLRETMDEDELDKLKRSGPRLSLLAKWLPREGKELDKAIGFVNRFAPLVFPQVTESSPGGSQDSSSWESSTKAKYRKALVALTSYMDLPEVLLALQRDDEIRFEKVTSRAAMRLRKTFLNEENKGNGVRSNNPKRIRLAERFMEFVIEKGLKGAQLMPHEIVKKILYNHNISTSEELVLDAQWKDLWKNVVEQTKAKAKKEGENGDFNPTRMVPLSDVSGSMSGTPMEVAIALGIGISEITHDAFKHMVLTFESNPRWHRLNPNDTIVKKVRSLQNAPWGGSTNFEMAYDLILDIAVKAKLQREDMPTLIVFSDMQFNQAAKCPGFLDETMHEYICRKVAKVARKLKWTDGQPTPIVYWNLRNTGGHPVDKETEGTVLLSGFSPSLLKLIMHGEALREEEVVVVQKDGTTVTEKVRVTPEQILRKMLDDSVYDPVREILIHSREGKLCEYEIPLSGPLGTM